MTLRALSLTGAIAISLLLIAFPFALGTRLSGTEHLALVVLLLGVSGAFVYGFGYVPDRRAWRALFHPLAAWTLIVGGAAPFVL